MKVRVFRILLLFATFRQILVKFVEIHSLLFHSIVTLVDTSAAVNSKEGIVESGLQWAHRSQACHGIAAGELLPS